MRNPLWTAAWVVILIATGCKNNNAADDSSEAGVSEVTTPVTVTNGSRQSIKDSTVLSAVSTYLLSADIKTNINGYIKSSGLHLGDAVAKGQTLFVLETKESKSLGNTIDKLDSSFKFSGISTIKSTASGYITMLNHQVGDYVQDGEILTSITDKNSFGFILNLPFEYRALVHLNQAVDIRLPDGSSTSGTVNRIMPQMDSASQTQQVFVKTTTGNIPSGLIASVVLTKDLQSGFTLPKDCVFADDSQQNFWVMKLINDSTAVKIPVNKGLENNSSVVITAPSFRPDDRFVIEGGYGLPDTAKIDVRQK